MSRICQKMCPQCGGMNLCLRERRKASVCVHTCGWVSIFINPSAAPEAYGMCHGNSGYHGKGAPW